MKRIFFITMTGIMLLPMSVGLGESELPAGPALFEHAHALSRLVRDSMREYHRHRTPAERLRMPEYLRDVTVRRNGEDTSLAELPVAVAVRLRHQGREVACEVARGDGLICNIRRASLRAMRSEHLPDRVSLEYLADLRVELILLGPERPTQVEKLPEVLEPGLVGLKLVRGVDDPQLRAALQSSIYREIHVLPCEAYENGWDRSEILRHCLRVADRQLQARGLDSRWSVFLTTHYVDYPGEERPWLLYRGKVLRMNETLSAEACRNTARDMGRYLLSVQNKDGSYRPDGLPPASLCGQLEAALAMARLGERIEDGRLRAGAAAAMGYAAETMLMRDEPDAPADVVALPEDKEVRAVGLLLLVADALPNDPQAEAQLAHLRKWLLDRVDEKGRLIALSGRAVDVDDAAVALAALHAGPTRREDGVERAMQALMVETGLAGSGSLSRHSPATLARLGLAMLAHPDYRKPPWDRFPRQIARELLSRRVSDGPADERGALRDAEGFAATMPSSLGAVFLAQFASANDDAAEFTEAAEGLRRFCAQMMVLPAEAYFAPEPENLLGAVRHAAFSARISPAACAAGIEAMLSGF